MSPQHPPYFQIPMVPPSASEEKKQHVKPKRKPLLRLEIRDLSEEGARAFLSCLDCSTVLEEAVTRVLDLLYSPQSHIPPTRSVTLILRSMPGVAFTTGKDLDDDHKEIHLSTDHIARIPQDGQKAEILGVLRHEMVHCWQWNANGTCPGGLIEGIADWVRLRSNFVPPHWKREWDGDWDAGYQHTGYFLDYLEERFGDGTVMTINERLREKEYDEKSFWMECCQHDIKTLWKDYGEEMDKKYGKKPPKDGNKDDIQHKRRSSDVISPAEGVSEALAVTDCGKVAED